MYDWDDNPDLNITPLVDIMLVLMAILMVTAPVMVYEEDIKLPVGSQKKSVKKIADLTVRIDGNRVIYIKDNRYNFDNFADNFLLNSKKYDKKTVVFIKADKDLKYNDVMYVLKVLKESGFSKVSLLTNG
jgi:biopolymer transport protein ExbD